MDIVDLVLILVVALAILGGFRRGFIVEIASILGVVIALAVARQEYGDVRHAFPSFLPQGPWTTVVAYLLVFAVVWLAVNLVARRIRFMVRLMLLGLFDRLGGAVIGFVEGIVLAVLLVYLGGHTHNSTLQRLIHHSALAPHLAQFNGNLNRFYPHIPQ